MIFLPVVTMVMYAMFGAPPLAPVTPAQASEPGRQIPRNRKGEPCSYCPKAEGGEGRLWRSDTAIGPDGEPRKIDGGQKKRKKPVIQPRVNKGYNLRLTACGNKEASAFYGKGWGPPPKRPESRSANRSSSYTLSEPTVLGVPRIATSDVKRKTDKRPSAAIVGHPPVRNTKSRPAEVKKKHHITENIDVTHIKTSLCRDPMGDPISKCTTSTGNKETEADGHTAVPPVSRMTSGPGLHPAPTVADADKTTSTTVRRTGKASSWLEKATKTITRVSRDPKTKIVTVYECETRPLPKTRPNAAPMPPRRWRF